MNRARNDLALLEAAMPAAAYRPVAATPTIGFRAFATSKQFCGLDYSPLMSAIADASAGREVTTIDDAMCEKHFGCKLDALPRRQRRTIAVRAGGRGGKSSRLLAVKALHAAWTVPLPTLNPGEPATSLIVAPDMKLARHTLSFVAGYVDASPVLRKALVKDPTADMVTLRRPDGKVVHIEVLAASRGGRATRARTLVFVGMDEASFFYAEGTGVVNDAEIFSAVAMRVVPGGQVWVVSTPWLADTGLLEKSIKKEWGVHEHALVVTAGTRALNPTWDPDGSIEKAERERDPDAAKREIDGEPLTGGAFTFFDPQTVDAAVDATLLLPRRAQPREEVSAGGDFGFRSDAAAVVISHRTWIRVPDIDPVTEMVRISARGVPLTKPLNVFLVADLLELTPKDVPLKPSHVVAQFAERIKTHAGLEYLVADGHYRESVSEHLAEHGLGFVLAPAGAEGVAKAFMRARHLFREGRIRLPDHARLIAQLKSIKWQALPGGGISIIKPRVSARADRGGSHCDLADAFVLSLWELSATEVDEPAPEPGTYEALIAEGDAIKRELERELEERMSQRGQEDYYA